MKRVIFHKPHLSRYKGRMEDSLAYRPMKDVESCDKLRVVANKRLSGDFRMEQSMCGNAHISISEHIGY